MALTAATPVLVRTKQNRNIARFQGKPMYIVQYTKLTGDTTATNVLTGLNITDVREAFFSTGNGVATPATSGGVAAVKTVTINTNPSAGQTLTVGGKTYTFVASGATGDQINIGADAAATATALNTRINADTLLTLCTSSVAAAVLTLTANTPGVDFLVETTSPGIAIAITTQNVASRIDLSRVNLSGLGTETSGFIAFIGLPFANFGG